MVTHSPLEAVARVKRLSILTYFLNRQDINSCMTVVNLLSDWPFLLTEEVFHDHANEFLGFNVQTRLVTAVQEKGLA